MEDLNWIADPPEPVWKRLETEKFSFRFKGCCLHSSISSVPNIWETVFQGKSLLHFSQCRI